MEILSLNENDLGHYKNVVIDWLLKGQNSSGEVTIHMVVKTGEKEDVDGNLEDELVVACSITNLVLPLKNKRIDPTLAGDV